MLVRRYSIILLHNAVSGPRTKCVPSGDLVDLVTAGVDGSSGCLDPSKHAIRRATPRGRAFSHPASGGARSSSAEMLGLEAERERRDAAPGAPARRPRRAGVLVAGYAGPGSRPDHTAVHDQWGLSNGLFGGGEKIDEVC